MYIYDDSNDFYSEQCNFINNSVSVGSGGVIYGVRRETIALIIDSVFARNSAPLCGVADMLTITDGYHNNFTAISSLFTHNSATDNTSDVGGLGGVACVEGGSITSICSTFTDNVAAQNGGVFYANESALTVSQSLFSRNYAVVNGGVTYANHSSNSISDTVFNSNSASNNGGALFIRAASGQGTIHNSISAKQCKRRWSIVYRFKRKFYRNSN
jgi:predicted outer membrane repeat protein